MNKTEVLKNCTVHGEIIKLPNVQLDRAVYLEVKKTLELIGGKWKGGKISGFVFNTDPSDLLSQIANGEDRNLKKEFQFFATPKFLADEMVGLADLRPGDVVMEPSCGQGAIVEFINKAGFVPFCYELMETNIAVLNKSGLRFTLLGKDFMTHKSGEYSSLPINKIIANPPFSKSQDIDHIEMMYKSIEKGVIVTICSVSSYEGNSKKQKQFRKFIDEVAEEVISIERGTFKDSGTMVPAVVIVIDK